MIKSLFTPGDGRLVLLRGDRFCSYGYGSPFTSRVAEVLAEFHRHCGIEEDIAGLFLDRTLILYSRLVYYDQEDAREMAMRTFASYPDR